MKIFLSCPEKFDKKIISRLKVIFSAFEMSIIDRNTQFYLEDTKYYRNTVERIKECDLVVAILLKSKTTKVKKEINIAKKLNKTIKIIQNINKEIKKDIISIDENCVDDFIIANLISSFLLLSIATGTGS